MHHLVSPKMTPSGSHQKPRRCTLPDAAEYRHIAVRAERKPASAPADRVPTPSSEELRSESEGSGRSTAAGEDRGLGSEEGEDLEEEDRPRKRPAGYTPFEYVTFGETQLTHELAIQVCTAPHVIKKIKQAHSRS